MSAWFRLVIQTIEKGVMTAEQRFGLHGFSREGVADMEGMRVGKQEVSGHRSQVGSMTAA
ncbi:hypothetical protein DBL09_29745 [Pseudomonas aeruginosa]|nr:hypothetical protein DBL08_17790 [Pseudomonas aeruginosa]PTV78671.1 hypothetical protein DBL09_29745 [Pseudomonas aeruginosa]PTV86446.1 hypothetical protein DBL10_06460 [Pseudomonas aeruginosa]